MSKRDENELNLAVAEEKVVDTVKESVQKVVKPVDTLASVKAIGANSKIGVTKYLQLYPQSVDVTTVMKKKYAMEFHTVAEWNKIVEKLINKKA